MADITRHPLVPFARHLRSDPNMYVRHLRNGDVAHEGVGTAFWFRPQTAALSQVPLDDREQALLFHARTADFQDVTVQATVSYRIVDPALATTRIDFGVNPNTGAWNNVPLETLGDLLTELAQQPAVEQLAGMTMREALADGLAPVRDMITRALAADARLTERGIEVSDVRVVAIRTDPEVERAMQTQTREQVQQEADRATYERRAVAVERERSIAENELQNQIELARREEDLVGQRGQNDRRRAAEEAAATAITAEADAGLRRLRAETEAEATRLLGEAKAATETARYTSYQGVDPSVMLALAAQELARHLPAVEQIVVTPDLLTSLATSLTGGGRGPKTAVEPS
ncbi:MAG: SPFH domain-containing protein [Acidimicrobiales bacterium]